MKFKVGAALQFVEAFLDSLQSISPVRGLTNLSSPKDNTLMQVPVLDEVQLSGTDCNRYCCQLAGS